MGSERSGAEVELRVARETRASASGWLSTGRLIHAKFTQEGCEAERKVVSVVVMVRIRKNRSYLPVRLADDAALLA